MATGSNQRRFAHGFGPVAAPIATIFGSGVLLRRIMYDRGLLPQAVSPVFTISVGGLEAGGSGKTPVTDYVLRALLRAGRTPGLLSRGYGRSSRGLVVRRPGGTTDAAVLGDEPAMLVGSDLDIHAAICGRRSDGAEALAAEGCDVLVLDDGFSHRALHRDVDMVVLRGERPFGAGHLLPWGMLREPCSSLRRARVVWLHYRSVATPGVPPWWERYCSEAVFVASEAHVDGPRDRHGRTVDMKSCRVVAAAGIARPEDFARSLRELEVDVGAFVPFGDHHRYAAADVERLKAAIRQCGADALVVTPKDAVKLVSIWDGPALFVVGVRVAVRVGARVLADVLHVPNDSLPQA